MTIHMFDNWRKRAIAAEAENVALKSALALADEHLQAISVRLANRAALISIVQQKRVNKFVFVRNEKMFVVETYSTMEDNIAEWKRNLLE